MHCLSMTWVSKRAWQTGLIVIGEIVGWRKRQITPSSTISWCTRFGTLSANYRHVSIRNILSIDMAYVCDNVSPPWSWVKRLVFLMLLTVARMVMWVTQTGSIIWNERYSHNQDLTAFFMLKVKIRTDKMWIVSADFSEGWVRLANLVSMNRIKFDFLF